MSIPIQFSKRGGAQVGSVHGSWPFGKIEISNSSVTVRVLGKSRTLTEAEVLRVESLGFFASSEGGPGVRIFFRAEHWEEFVDFHSLSAHREILEVLKQAGFNVVQRDK
jgi:hypothetical protein